MNPPNGNKLLGWSFLRGARCRLVHSCACGLKGASVSHSLTSVLSESAAELYERLVTSGGLPLDGDSHLLRTAAAKELIDKGFARERYVDLPLLVPVEPIRAVDNAILTRQRQILDQ